jgi:isopropylmalate/homocitrate/citramalate synthase
MGSAAGHLADDARDVVIVEVGPRDGLQNEPQPIPTDIKIAFVDALSRSGLPVIEVTSFVNPKAVPQLADAAEVMTGIARVPGVRYPVLVPNARGLERSLEAGVEAIALFTAASEEFAEANVGTTIDGTFERFAPVVTTARERGIWIRGYVSVAFGCPYAGNVDPRAVVAISERLLALGCDEICLADTIGKASPDDVRALLSAVLPSVPVEKLSLHFHDTSGMALANVEASLAHGVRIFDAAAGGLGGCPFAPGAPGNLATGLLLDRLHLLGLRTGVDPDLVAAAVEDLWPSVPRLQSVHA